MTALHREFFLFAVLLLAHTSLAQDESSPSKDDAREGWTAPPEKRGTIDILWSCLSTIFICIWASLHLNVPGPGEHWIWQFLRKLKWALFTAIVPEFVLWLATTELGQCWVLVRLMRAKGYPCWTMSQSFAVSMGAVSIEYSDEVAAPISLYDFWRLIKNDDLLTSKDVSFATVRQNLYGQGIATRWPSYSSALASEPVPLQELEDKSKADAFVRLVACLQAIWLVVQCIGRQIEKLPVAPLEVMAIAYVTVGLLLYVAWWDKPLDVGTPFVIRCRKASSSVLGDSANIPTRVKNDSVGFGDCWEADIEDDIRSIITRKRTEGSTEWFEMHVLNQLLKEFWSEARNFLIEGLIFIFAGTTFGAVHIAAWNFPFATWQETLLWRIAAAAATGLLPLYWALSFLDRYAKLKWLENLQLWILTIPYVVFRLYLLVAPFVALRSMPVGTYDNYQWSSYVPHIL